MKKEELVEQIAGLENILDQAKQNLIQKISSAFHETFDLKNIEYSDLFVGRERAEFKFDNKWGGEVNLYYYETYDESEAKLEMSIPSFRDTEFSRVISYGKVAEQAKLNGDLFITKLELLKKEYKNGVSTVLNMLGEAKKTLIGLENEEAKQENDQVFDLLVSEGYDFGKTVHIQVGATSSIWADKVKVIPVKGKKTFDLEFSRVYDEQVVSSVWNKVREKYITDLITQVIRTNKFNSRS